MHEKDPFRGEYKTAPQLVVLDFDRTLGNVAAAMERLFLTTQRAGIATDTITQAQQKTEADGGSFDPISYIEAQLNAQEFAAFLSAYVNQPEPALLYPDAERLLARLQTSSIPFMVVTYGKNPTWQHLKVAASGYCGPLSIISHPHKGQELTSWENPTTTQFSPPGLNVRTPSICLVDDKPISFANLPTNCKGYWLVRSGKQLPSQQGSVPEHVIPINSLDELQIENGRLTHTKPVHNS